jgi:hypothetical protein
MLVQKKVHGRKLADITDGELLTNPVVLINLVNFYKACIQMWDQAGRMPDFLWGGKWGAHFNYLNPRNSTNVMIETETNKVYLVDVAAPTAYFSKQSFFPLPLQQEIIKRNMEKIISKFVRV